VQPELGSHPNRKQHAADESDQAAEQDSNRETVSSELVVSHVQRTEESHKLDDQTSHCHQQSDDTWRTPMARIFETPVSDEIQRKPKKHGDRSHETLSVPVWERADVALLGIHCAPPLASLIDRERLARDGQRRGPRLTGAIGLDLVDDSTVARTGGPADYADPAGAARRAPRATAGGLH